MTLRKNSTAKTPSYDEVLSTLESARKEYKEFDEGHRKELYQSMQRVAEAAVLVVADEKIKTRYCKKMGEKDALRAAITFIFDAKSTPEKKDASKRTLALWYLIEKLEVPVGDIAKAIPKNGGIGKLASLAAKSRQDELGEKADENGKAKHKLGKQISIGLSPNHTNKLSRFADKTRIKIIGHVRKSSDESPTIQVEKLLKLVASGKSKSKEADEKPDDDENDWEE